MVNVGLAFPPVGKKFDPTIIQCEPFVRRSSLLYVLIDSPSSPRNFARSVFTTPVRGELWPDQEEIIGALLGDQPIQSTASKSSK